MRILSKMMDTSDEWINERTGIKERRHIKKGDGNTTATMALKAAKIALERANMAAEDLDLILFATLSPDYYFPGSGRCAPRLIGYSCLSRNGYPKPMQWFYLCAFYSRSVY